MKVFFSPGVCLIAVPQTRATWGRWRTAPLKRRLRPMLARLEAAAARPARPTLPSPRVAAVVARSVHPTLPAPQVAAVALLV